MDNTNKIKYGLYHIKKEQLLTYIKSSNDGQEFCNDYTLSLSIYGDEPWLVDRKEYAEWTRVFNQRWFNSSMDSPMCDFDPEELKVVEIRIQTEYKFIDVNIPTKYEFYEDRFKSNPREWKRVKEDMYKMAPYNIFELDEYKSR